MISQKMQEALNAQINAELWSAYLYFSMSMDAVAKGFAGAAHWFDAQAKEEQEHVEKFINYMHKQEAKVVLAPIAAVKTQWNSLKEMFAETYAHEQQVTALIHNLCNLAVAEEDFATANMLQWFVNEQVEEEHTAHGILCATEHADCMVLDEKLGKR
jgi:ferritin